MESNALSKYIFPGDLVLRVSVPFIVFELFYDSGSYR